MHKRSVCALLSLSETKNFLIVYEEDDALITSLIIGNNGLIEEVISRKLEE